MSNLFGYVYAFLHSPAGLVLLLVALGFGLWKMNRQPAGNLSQRLMRWRVGLQFAVIVAILGIVLLRQLTH